MELKYKKYELPQNLDVLLLEVGTHNKSAKPGFGEFVYNLGLGYIAKSLINNNYSAEVYQQYDEPEEKFLKIIEKTRPKYLGMSSWTFNYPRTKSFVNKVRNKFPGIKTIAGGIHATSAPREVAKDFDYVVVGEGEETILDLLNSIDSKKSLESVKGLAYYEGQKFYISVRGRLQNLDLNGAPFRNLDILGMYEGTQPKPPEVKGFTTIQGQRGCPFVCEFCTNEEIRGRSVVHRDFNLIFDEMKELKEKEINHFWFEDEDMFIAAESKISLAKKISSTNLNVKWGGMASVNALDSLEKSKKLEELVRGGFSYVGMGIETPKRETYSLLKWRSYSQMFQIMSNLLKVGVYPAAYFIIGNPGETRKELEVTKKIANRLPIIRYRFSFPYPFLRTITRNKIDAENLWISEKVKNDLSLATTDTPVLKTELSTEELTEYRESLYEEIYTSETYKRRLDKFVGQHPTWKDSMSEWKNLLIEIYGAKIE